jgi:hypothetical protein
MLNDLGTVVVVVLIVFRGLDAFGDELVGVGFQKQLLVDDYVIAETRSVTRVLGKVEKKGVVMDADILSDYRSIQKFPNDDPRQGDMYFGFRTTVQWNERDEKFQLLYRVTQEDTTGYAESVDGIRWKKPFIAPDGLSNHITYRGSSSDTFYETSFMIDSTVPWGHPEKYKAAYNPGNTMCAIAYSSDGIHWKGYNNGESVTGRAADTSNQILWDPISSRYLLVTRTDLGEKGGLGEVRATRIMGHTRGNDILNHPEAWETLATIRVDDPKGEITQHGVMKLQMEAMNVWVYENIYFGLMHVLTAGALTGAEGAVAVAEPDARPESDVVDFYIGTSRDGVLFDRSWIYARAPMIERGGDGAFDKGMLSAVTQILTRGDEHWIYYSGAYSQHHARKILSAQKLGGKIGLATLPLDRFIAREAREEWGTIETKPFTLEGYTLEVNVDAHQGQFYVEVLDADGDPESGFSAEEAKVFSGVDKLRLRPSWNGGDLSRLQGKAIRLKFYLSDAKIYAFQVRS